MRFFQYTTDRQQLASGVSYRLSYRILISEHTFGKLTGNEYFFRRFYVFTFQWIVKEVQECCVCYQRLDGIRFLIDGYIVIVQCDEVTSLSMASGA